MNPTERSNPLREPLLIALLALLGAMLVLSAMIFYRLSQPGEKGVAEFSLYGTLFGTFTTAIGALVQALSRDPATARMNAAAAVTNATTLQNATPSAPPPVVVVPAPSPVDPQPTEVTGLGGGPVQTEEART